MTLTLYVRSTSPDRSAAAAVSEASSVPTGGRRREEMPLTQAWEDGPVWPEDTDRETESHSHREGSHLLQSRVESKARQRCSPVERCGSELEKQQVCLSLAPKHT